MKKSNKGTYLREPLGRPYWPQCSLAPCPSFVPICRYPAPRKTEKIDIEIQLSHELISWRDKLRKYEHIG